MTLSDIGLWPAQLWDYGFEGSFPYAAETEAFEHLEKHVEHYKPPECLPLLEGTMVCQIRVNRGQMVRDHALPLLKRMASPQDIAVVNFAWASFPPLGVSGMQNLTPP